MKQLSKTKREKLMTQVLAELEHSRTYKQRRTANWLRNDRILSGEKSKTDVTRSNINILGAKTQGFVNTLLSKVDTAPNIKFSPGEEADLKKARRANALLEKDSAPANGNWSFKDLMGKKAGMKYGRVIFEYHASSIGGYKSHLTLVDSKDFFIDPEAGGIDIERANYLGRVGIRKSEKQLKDGKKSKLYIGAAVDKLLRFSTEKRSEEDVADGNRYYKMQGRTKRLQRQDEWDLVEWGTTFEGEKYYVLFHEASKEVIRALPYKEVFASGQWSYSTYATDPDQDEFWTAAPLDQVIEIFMGQHILVNQQLDNNEQINQPMRGFDTDAIKDIKTMTWRRNGNIPFKKGTDMSRAIKIFAPQPLTTNVETYNLLDVISQTETGVTSDTKGLSDQETLGIYEGNLQASADRLGLLNKSYTDCYNRLAIHYYNGLKEHLNEKIAIKMIGSNGVEYEDITKESILPGGKEFDVEVSASEIELANESSESKNKLALLANYKGDATKNQNAIFEIEANIAGFSPDDIRRIMDVDVFGNAEIISEAAGDLQKMLQGTVLTEPNSSANTAYKQYLVNKLEELGDSIKPEIQMVVITYIDSLEDVIIKNTARRAKQVIAEQNKKQVATLDGTEQVASAPIDIIQE